jgi:Cd2+/Zn2+-exporting ATPase
MSKQSYRVTGMDCAECARTIETGVARLPGVAACQLHFATGVLTVDGSIARDVVANRVRQLGYGVADAAGGTADGMSGAPARRGLPGFLGFLLARRNTTLAALGAILILPGAVFSELLGLELLPPPLSTAASLAALVLAGAPVARSAWRAAVINREVTMNALMTIAALGAVLIGATGEAGLVMVLFAIGEALEGYTMQRARDSVRGLMQLAPAEAIALRPCLDCAAHLGQIDGDGRAYEGGPCPFCGIEEIRLPVSELRVGDVIVVRPGERIPMDGRVMAGASAVNQAPITGESAPAGKAAGHEVFAGSINGEGALKIEVTRLAADNTLSRMARLIEEAQSARAPAQRFVDRFARVYTPLVVGVAALVAILPPVLFGAPFLPGPADQGWLYRALELLVVACPCALVISTPVSLISAIANAARHGVLIKGGAHLETLSAVRVVAFDKTGTLTAGQPAVVAVRSAHCADPASESCPPCDDLLALAGAVERHSEHPLARAVVDASSRRGVLGRYPSAESVSALAGQAVVGRVDGKRIAIGSHAFFEQTQPHPADVCGEVEAASRDGRTPVLVSVDDRYAGYIAISDVVRPTSRAAIADLKTAGIARVVMLTGDTAAAAHSIARDVGVTEVRAGLLPEHKLDAVRELRRQYGRVAMAGDGINDAPALAAADVGIAIGAGASAQALETADVAVMSDDLTRLPHAVRLSQAAMRVVRANIALSIGIKLVFFVLVLLGLGSMWMAVFADMGTSLLVTLNGMRLAGFRSMSTSTSTST